MHNEDDAWTCYEVLDPEDPTFTNAEVQYSLWAHTLWDCPSCNSKLFSLYIERSSQCHSETDTVPCPVCGDTSHSVYSSHHVSVQILAEGSKRITKAEFYKRI